MTRLASDLVSSVVAARKAAGLTQAELALAADVSRQTISAIEQGDYNPSTSLALRLAILLEVPVERLFALPAAAVAELHERRSEIGAKTAEGATR